MLYKKYPLFVMLFLAFSLTFSQTPVPPVPKLYGLTPYGGGPYGAGTLFSVNGDGTGFNTPVKFGYINPGANPLYTKPVMAHNGKLYGVTVAGGANNKGVIFSYDTATGIYTDVYDFNTLTGCNVKGSLIEGDNGKLYGLTNTGNGGNGVIFSFDPDSNIYRVLRSFFGGPTGYYPDGSLLKASDGKFYGTTQFGGPLQDGTLFRFDPVTLVYDTLHSFGSATSGSQPMGTLVQAANGLLYGTTSEGGYNQGYGVLFSLDPVTREYKDLVDFGKDNDAFPTVDLLVSRNGKKIYGMTNLGTIYNYDTDSSKYSTVYRFSFQTGNAPNGGLMQGPGNTLYGMTSQGAVGFGTLFSFNTDSSSYRVLHNFGQTAIDGESPWGTPVLVGNKIFALTTSGPAGYGAGTMFSYHLGTGTYTRLFNFNQNTGSKADGSLTQGNGNKFYGVTTRGGKYGFGSIFSYDPRTNALSVGFDFNDTLGGVPTNEKLCNANDGKLYGTTSSGGKNHYGVLFSYDPETGIYERLHDFDGNHYTYQCGVMQATNGLLYGITNGVGDNGAFIFNYNISTKTFTTLPTRCSNTYNSNFGTFSTLLQAGNSKLYGLSNFYTPSSNYSALISYDIKTDTLTLEHTFDYSTTGNSPRGSLIKGPNGNLYGTFSDGPNNILFGSGGIFTFNPDSGTFRNLYIWSYYSHSKGNEPLADLYLASDGKMYGTTQTGGSFPYPRSPLGSLFRFNPDSNTVQDIFYFDSINGYNPMGNVVEYGCVTAYKHFNKSLCTGDSYTFRNKTYFTPGIYSDTLHQPEGACDSIIVLTIQTTREADTLSRTICSNQTYLFKGVQLNNTGDYRDTLKNINGCDSVVLLHLKVLPAYSININQSICTGDTFFVGKKIHKTSGIYNDTIPASNGCDSAVHLQLTVYPPVHDTVDVIICQTDSFFFKGKKAEYPGYYRDTLQNIHGCDSFVFLRLTILYDAPYNNYSVCPYDTFFVGGKRFAHTEEGYYSDTLTNMLGCDSVVEFYLNVYTPYQASFSRTICAGDAYYWRDSAYTEKGDHPRYFQNKAGCDSLITLHLNVLQNSVTGIIRSICQGDTLHVGKYAHFLQGHYSDTLQKVNGCDSIIDVQLSVGSGNTLSIVKDTIWSTGADNATYAWTNCENGTQVPGATQAFLAHPAVGRYAIVTTSNNCVDTSACIVFGITDITGIADDALVSVYPDPAVTHLTIVANNFSAETIAVYDLSGKKLLEEEYHSPVDIATLTTGIYLLEVKGNGVIVRKKFVKMGN